MVTELQTLVDKCSNVRIHAENIDEAKVRSAFVEIVVRFKVTFFPPFSLLRFLNSAGVVMDASRTCLIKNRHKNGIHGSRNFIQASYRPKSEYVPTLVLL